MDNNSKNRLPVNNELSVSIASGESFNLLEKISNAFPDAIIMMDLDNKITLWNKGAELMFGYSREESIGLNLQKILATDEFYKKYLQRIPIFRKDGINKEKCNTIELKAKKRDNKVIDIEVSLSSIKIGKSSNYVGIIRDVTDRKISESLISQFGQILDNSLNEFYLYDKSSLKILNVNAGAAKNLGYTMAELKNLTFWDIQNGQTKEVILGFIKPLNDGKKKKVVFNSYLKRKNNSRYPVEIHLQLMPFNNKQVYVSNTLDISHRLETEKALSLSEAKYRGLVDHLEIGISVINKNMEVLTFNKKIEELFPSRKIKNKSICYKNFNLKAKNQICSICPTLKTFKDGKVHEVNSEMKINGKKVIYRVVSSPVFDETGKIDSAIEMIEDITDRKKIEEDLKFSKEMYRRAIQNAQGVPYQYDYKSDKYVFIGEESIELFGVPNIEFTTQLMQKMMQEHKVLDNKFKKDPLQYIKDFKEGQIENYKADFKIKLKNGKEKWISDSSVPILDSKTKKVTGSFGILQDITERKDIESQLAQSQKLESIGQLAAGISHEINTPIQFVSDNTHFFRDSFQDFNELFKKYRYLIEKCKEIEDLNSSVNEILEFEKEIDLDYLIEDIPEAINQSLVGLKRVSKIVKAMREFSHPGKEEKTKININNALENTIIISKNEWKYVAEVKTQFDEQIPLVNCLPGELNQVFLNMIVNAAHTIEEKYKGTLKKGLIEIKTSANSECVIIKISDTGKGMSKEVLSKIFDPFFTTKEVGKGTGQGLAISHSVIIQKHNGKIDVESEVGKGSTFIIKIPIDSV